MSLLRSTVELYRDAAIDATRALGRSAWGVGGLCLASIALVLAGFVVAPFGMAGGFAYGMAECFAVGWVLSLVEIGVIGQRRVHLADFRDSLGAYFWEVLSVLFVFFVGQLVLQFSVPFVLPVVVPLCALLFNPAPEMIYTERSQSFALLQDALGFMQRNWPEWIGAQGLGGLFVAIWMALFLGPWPGVGAALELVQLFGPWFGFVNVGTLAIGFGPLAGVLGTVTLVVFAYWFLLFRGHLYKRLRGTSRRGRAWQARARGRD